MCYRIQISWSQLRQTHMELHRKMETCCFFSLLILKMVALGFTMNCFQSSSSISCMCNDTSLSCIGVQDKNSDILEIVQNVSATHVFGKLQTICINVANLSFTSNKTFQGFGLSYLKLGSDLLYLDDAIFSNLSLNVLDLSHNALSEVPMTALTNMRSLHELNLSNNAIQSTSIISSLVLSNLTVLSLSNNNISTIDDGTFFGVKKLEVLSLDNNALSHFGETDFESLINLLELTVSGNYLQQLKTSTFSYLPSIQKLVLDENNFSDITNIDIEILTLIELSVRNCSLQGKIKEDHLYDLPNLESLDLSFNNLSGVYQFALSGLENLKILNLSNNNIKDIDSYAFSKLKNLVELDLSNNVVKVVRSSAFFSLIRLKHLNLFNNELSAFTCSYTADLVSLESINIDNNNLKILDTGTFMYSSGLKTLKIDGNILDCTCLILDFASYLQNRSVFDDSAGLIKCASPSTLQGKNVIEVDFSSMACPNSVPCPSPYLNELEQNRTTTMSLTDVTPESTAAQTVGLANISDFIIFTGTTDSYPMNYTNQGNSTPFYSITTTDNTSLINSSTEQFTQTSMLPSNNNTVWNITESTPVTSISDTTFLVNHTSDSVNVTVFSVTDVNQTLIYESNSSNSANFTISSTFYSAVSSTRNETTEPSGSLVSVTPSVLSPIIIQNSSLTNGNFCVEWLVTDGVELSNVRCVLSYTYGGGKTMNGIRCPRNNNVPYHQCAMIKAKNDFLEVCLVMYNKSTKNVIDENCLPSFVLETTTAFANVSIETSLSANQTNGASNTTDYAITSVKTSSEITLNQTDGVSVFPTSEITSTLSKEMTEITSMDLSVTENNFFITLLNVSEKSDDSFLIEWEVNRNEAFSSCTLNLHVNFTKVTVKNSNFHCSGNSYLLSNLVNGGVYNICLTSHHFKYGNASVCKLHYFIQTSPGTPSPVTGETSWDTHQFLMGLLIGLLILALCIIALIVLRAVFKKTSEVRYDVSAEERKVSMRHKSASSVRSSSERYSYCVNEKASIL